MKAAIIAQVVTEVYNNGHVKAGGQKLEYDDFLQMVYMVKAAMVEDRIRQDRLQGEFPSLEDMLQREVLDIQTDKYNRKFVTLGSDPISLPDNLGIYTVLPLSEVGAQFCNPMIRMQPGSEWLFCRDTGGVATFVPYGTRVTLQGLPDCIKQVEVSYVGNSEDSDVPDAMGFDIARAIWREVFRNITIPVDKMADGNPNFEEVYKNTISSPQTK